ncbi:MAG: hypothetical protein OJF59_003299 [Cytophagales bacterium]|jgi:hypothetical protein|nr:hypothetical protein [Bacteroidota bacterium]MBS1982169.1 hypothetical protein [Bacteroidota bacterium]WHZ09543.1 MAG: hypothetical protein OJF59_003299 [Cytophagales bacterium]
MKPNILFSMVAFVASLTANPVLGQADEAAIKEVIAQETYSYFTVDRKNWENCWWKVPHAYWSYADSTWASFVDGWEAINKNFDHYFKTARPSRAEITNEWKYVKIYGNSAYVRFIQKVKDEIDHDDTSQVRVLEKKDGKWKIVCVSAVAIYPKK